MGDPDYGAGDLGSLWSQPLLIIRIEMSVVLAVALVLLVTLPALYDLITARAAGLTINDTTLSRGMRASKLAKSTIKKIKHIRFDTRLDHVGASHGGDACRPKGENPV